MADFFPGVNFLSSRWWAVLLCAAIPMSTLSSFACAESLPASVRACTAATDPDQRLACFDREVARFPDLPSQADLKRNASSECCTHSPDSAHRDPKSDIVSDSPEQSRSGSSNEQRKATEITAQNEPRRVTARIVSIKNATDDMTVQLDNGDVWEQAQESSGTMNLRPGDTVSIDRSLGSYWLSGRSQMVMKVRRKE